MNGRIKAVTELEIFFKHFVHYCQYGNTHGWHENGTGGMSMLMPDEIIMKLQSQLDMSAEYKPLGVKVPMLGREFCIVTSEGEIWDEIEERFEHFSGIVQIGPKGDSYRKVYGLNHGQALTSDFPIHLLIHESILKKTKQKRSIVYHCHPINITTLTYFLPLEDKAFTEALVKASVHCALNIKGKIGVVDRLTLTMEDLCSETVKKIENSNIVVWPYHGVICCGESFPHLMGSIEMAEKAAAIRLKLIQMSDKIMQEPKIEDLNILRENVKRN